MHDSLTGSRLRTGDFALLAVFCLVLFGYSVIGGRALSGHESVLPQNAREMAVNHDWLIPTLGGQPWLERPPLPDWLFVAVDALFHQTDNDGVVRIPPVLCSVLIVLLVGWLGAVCYGRSVGLLTGLILATMWEFFSFASDPESDIFLCLIVTGVVAMFVHLELRQRRAPTESTHFLGTRPWPVFGFFILLGLTNLAKGLVFGTLMAAVPVVGFLCWNADFAAARRYLWLWGWLAFLVVSAAWPVLAVVQHPEIWDLWDQNYAGRLYRGYIGEPVWYYLLAIPFVILPWTFPALVGLWQTGARAWRERGSVERLLWAWALLTPAVFSIPNGKHHHYLLHCLTPWAIFAALGAVRGWQWLQSGPSWLRQPLWGALALGLVGDLALLGVAHRIPGPPQTLPICLVALPLFAFGCCWSATRKDGRLAAAGSFVLLGAVYLGQYAFETKYVDGYRDDLVFMKQVRERVSADEPLFIKFDGFGPLETCWLFFYSDERAVLVNEWPELAAQRGQRREAYVLARAKQGAQLAAFGPVEMVLSSKHTKGEHSPIDRRTLFHIHFDDRAAPRAGSPVGGSTASAAPIERHGG